MLRFLSKSIPSSNKTPSQLLKLYSTSSQDVPQDSFTVQYLINQCGFSMEKAVLASSKNLIFHNPDQPNSVLSFFKKQGFTDHQIKKVVAIEPKLLSYNPHHVLLPIIQFFKSNGFSDKDLAKTIIFFPTTFNKSLEEFIEPSFNFIKDFLGSEKDAVLAISNSPRLLLQLECYVKSAIAILHDTGMSQSGISRLMKTQPSVFLCGDDKLKECVKQLGDMDMDMDPESDSYGVALMLLIVTRRDTWERRMEAFKKWGCSEEDVLTGFKINPIIMNISEEKLNAMMSFFVREIGFQPSEVVRKYLMFTMSLKKDLVPRWAVCKVLLSKGLVKEGDVPTMFQMNEDRFLEMFVNCHEKQGPSLLELYREKQK